ncbi:hypothetical protein B0A55_10807 [Friedmanniomyces simplex]|uniref:Uncharacterized protein n=1 Tax=Friedmanniomyces simplex TaxID=329884 RepID=A0A4U0X792_9PEZI|nr:hypothetical protein B0A55_10807 [Friedmanniomyces simplex]
MFRASRDFKTLSTALKIEDIVFKNVTMDLLQNVLNEYVIAELFNGVKGKSWSISEVDEAFREKMRGSYSAFLDAAIDMQETLQSFRLKLHLDTNGNVMISHNDIDSLLLTCAWGLFEDRKALKEACKRLNFGINKAAYQDLLNEIGSSANKRLVQLLDQHRRLAQEPTNRCRMPKVDAVRFQGSKLFGALQRGLYGSCKESHKASVSTKKHERWP